MKVVRSPEALDVDGPCLIDRFLEGALELDVDALCDGEEAWVAAVLEHVEPAGVHSGDSACVVPGAVRDRRSSRSRSARRRARSLAASVPAACSTFSSPCTRAGCTCSRRTRARRARFRSWRRRPAFRSWSSACRLLLGESVAALALPGARDANPRVGEGVDLPERALRRRRGALSRDALHRRGDGERRRRLGGLRPRSTSCRAHARRWARGRAAAAGPLTIRRHGRRAATCFRCPSVSSARSPPSSAA